MSEVKHPIVTITAMYAGLQIAGFLGLLCAPLAVLTGLESGAVMTGELYRLEKQLRPTPSTTSSPWPTQTFYDGLIFTGHPGFMIQGGCPNGNGMGGPGYDIRGEFAGNGFTQNDLRHTTGVLSMARAMHPDSAGSQFFIMVAPAPHLDGQYAAFGQVTGGVEEAIRISEVPTDRNDKPKTPVVIQSIRVDTQGVDYPAPQKR